MAGVILTGVISPQSADWSMVMTQKQHICWSGSAYNFKWVTTFFYLYQTICGLAMAVGLAS